MAAVPIGTKHEITSARWDLFVICNLICLHCRAAGLFNKATFGYMRLSVAIEVINKLWDNGTTAARLSPMKLIPVIKSGNP